MALINVSTNVTCYADESTNRNPLVKFTDLTWSMLGMPSATPRETPVILSPGETKTIMTAERTLSFTGLTSFDIVAVPGTSDAQLVGSFGARTPRSDGDGTTEWLLTRTNQLVRLQWTGTGTAPLFTGMAAGDGVTIGSPFNILNQGDFVVVSKGVDYVEFVNPNATNETIVSQVNIYSSGPVQLGDILDLRSTQFSFPNRGEFKITRVTDSLVQFSNVNVVPETGIVGVASTDLSIYPEAYMWMLMAVDHRIVVRLNGDTGSGTEVEPPAEGDLAKNPGLFLKRGKVFRVDVYNPGLSPVSGMLVLAG